MKISLNSKKIFSSYSVDATFVLQQANKGLISLRHYVESHNSRISDRVKHIYSFPSNI